MVVLLVEDDLDDQEFIRQAFDELGRGHKLEIANNGREAIERLSEMPPHALPCLIILDINMPVLDGIEMLRILKSEQKFSDIPKVVFTTSNSITYKEESLSNGAADYLVKPSEMRSLVSSIEKMLHFCS